MSFYTDLRDDTVIPLIIEFGQDIKVTRYTDTSVWVKTYKPLIGGYVWINQDTSEESVTAPEPTKNEYTGKVVVTNYEDKLIDNTFIKRGDKRLLTITIPSPQTGDIFTVNGINYNYVSHDTVSPASEDVLYKIQVRV